jgi:Lrp/AsnC family transcriptional regulator, leucine-responsive regulatory protein
MHLLAHMTAPRGLFALAGGIRVLIPRCTSLTIISSLHLTALEIFIYVSFADLTLKTNLNYTFTMESKFENLDDLDLQILEHLSQNARITWTELSAQLGFSAPAITERVRKLEDRGVIRGYTVLLEPELLGCELLAFIAVQIPDSKSRKTFLEHIKKLPEVLECHHMSGDDDYWLKVRCAGTRTLERIVTEELKSISSSIKTRTSIALSSFKDLPNLPLRGA